MVLIHENSYYLCTFLTDWLMCLFSEKSKGWMPISDFQQKQNMRWIWKMPEYKTKRERKQWVHRLVEQPQSECHPRFQEFLSLDFLSINQEPKCYFLSYKSKSLLLSLACILQCWITLQARFVLGKSVQHGLVITVLEGDCSGTKHNPYCRSLLL